MCITAHCVRLGARFAVFGLLLAMSGFPDSAAQADEKPAEQSSTQVAFATPDNKPAKLARTRFIVGLGRKVETEVFSLANPNRVVVEFPAVALQLPSESDGVRGVVKTFQAGQAGPDKMRLVIEVTEPVIVESARVTEDDAGGYRLTLDIMPLEAAIKSSSKKSFLPPSGLGAGGMIQPPVPRRAESPKERAAKAFKPIIVLDPGHGGDDSGAVKLGTVEKHVVLAFGHVLRDLLEKTGRYKVLMTRSDDTFIPLDQRTVFAERNKANLFIAIHADYAQARARGATIFTLRDRVARDLARSGRSSAARTVLSADEIETVKKVSGDVDAVKDILADLATRDVDMTHERAGVFAKAVIENMSENTMMRSEPDQQAAFRVLKTAQFPSVLIELAYVTNKQDAENLNSDQWREKVAQSIVSAIDNYFSHDLSRMPM